MARRYDIDAPLLIAGHPIVAAHEHVLERWLRGRRTFFARERGIWRQVVVAQIVDAATGPERRLVRTKHGEGWLYVRGDADAATPDSWTLIDPQERRFIEADATLLDARHDAALPESEHAIVEHVEQRGRFRSVAAIWTTPSGLRVRVRVDIDAEAGPVADAVAETGANADAETDANTDAAAFTDTRNAGRTAIVVGTHLYPLELRAGRPWYAPRLTSNA